MVKKEKKDSKKKKSDIEEIIKQRDEYLDGWKRALADLENYKKQVEKEKEIVVQLLKTDILLKIIPIMDNWGKAEKNIPEDQKDSEWIKGVLAIKTQLEDFLKKENVEKIETVGKKFDPSLHEAFMQEESDKEEGVILEELEPGYKMGDRVIKYPKVKVSK